MSSAIARLESKETFDDLRIYIESYPNLELSVVTEDKFFENQASGSELIKVFGLSLVT